MNPVSEKIIELIVKLIFIPPIKVEEHNLSEKALPEYGHNKSDYKSTLPRNG